MVPALSHSATANSMTSQFHLRNGVTENRTRPVSRPNDTRRAQDEESLGQQLFMPHQDELQIARPAQPSEQTKSSSSSSVRCVGGRIVRPRQWEEESPSTARNSIAVSMITPGATQLGAVAKPPCFGCPPGLEQVPSIPLPPVPSINSIGEYIADCRDGAANPGGCAPIGSGGPGGIPTGEGVPPGGNPPNNIPRQPPPPPPENSTPTDRRSRSTRRSSRSTVSSTRCTSCSTFNWTLDTLGSLTQVTSALQTPLQLQVLQRPRHAADAWRLFEQIDPCDSHLEKRCSRSDSQVYLQSKVECLKRSPSTKERTLPL